VTDKPMKCPKCQTVCAWIAAVMGLPHGNIPAFWRRIKPKLPAR
jgi:hypothetical protein